MALQVTLGTTTRADLVINVEVVYDDSVTHVETARRVMTFQAGTTVAQVRQAALDLGAQYKTALATEATLKGAVGTVVAIP
jgi:hypothetical protein